MGGKTRGTNDAVVQEQRAQAEEARRKETERQGRLSQGMSAIRSAFEGGPVLGTRKTAAATAPAAPAAPGPIATVTPTPENELYETGETSAGFDDKFYDEYGRAVSDYYQPQVEKQYGDAQKELTYRLARSGNLRSDAAAGEVADLSEQYDLNKANVEQKADIAETDLRNTVAGQRSKIENALQSSEDPTQASNQALAAVRDISLQQPDLSPLGAIFNIATIGGANFLRGARNAQYANAFGERSRDTSRIV